MEEEEEALLAPVSTAPDSQEKALQPAGGDASLPMAGGGADGSPGPAPDASAEASESSTHGKTPPPASDADAPDAADEPRHEA